MVIAAPRTPITGFQSVEVKKSTSPNVSIASEDSLTSTMMMPLIKRMTVKDSMAVKVEKSTQDFFVEVWLVS